MANTTVHIQFNVIPHGNTTSLHVFFMYCFTEFHYSVASFSGFSILYCPYRIFHKRTHMNYEVHIFFFYLFSLFCLFLLSVLCFVCSCFLCFVLFLFLLIILFFLVSLLFFAQGLCNNQPAYHLRLYFVEGPGSSMSQVIELPNNSYKPITNTAWVHARLCKLQKRVHSTSSRK